MRKTLLAIVALFVSCCDVTAQELTAEQRLGLFVKNVNVFNKTFPQEKVYLHFDNTGYFIGENMWFKAFVVAGPMHKPSPLSKVLYVELLTPEGRVVQSCKLKVTKGQAEGRFQLGRLLHSGYYEVRAYTRMMLNWDEGGLFSRVFPVFDKAKTTQDYVNPKMTLPTRSLRTPDERQKPRVKVGKMNMMFFPEGGNLIAGLRQTVAFKVFSEDGQGKEISGKVIDREGKTYATFTTTRNGMGAFGITAYEDSKYTAIVTVDGKEHDFDLPQAVPYGYSLGITDQDSAYRILIQRSVPDEEVVGMAVSNGGSVFLFEKPEFDDDQYALSIEKDVLRDGVNQFVLFGQDGRPLARRLVFRKPAASTTFTAKFDKNTYKPFEKVTMDFDLHETDGTPVATTFSLAVRDKDTNLPGSHTGDLFSNLLLSSDLRGFIEDIDWYFETDDKEHDKALDNLMLTQGWYRYDWRQMAHPEDFKIEHYIEEGLMLSGTLSSYYRHKSKEGSMITVILYDTLKGDMLKGRAKADSLGHFAFLAEDFYGRWQMFINTKDKDKRKEMDVHLDRQFTPDSRAYEPLDTWMYIKDDGQTQTDGRPTDDGPDRRKLDKYKYENLLPETTITAEKRWMEGKATKHASIVYDLEEERTREDDTGELYLESLFDYMERNNKYFTFELDSNGRHKCYYKNRDIKWIIDNKDYSLTDVERINAKDIEAIIINERFGAALQYMPFGLDSINNSSGNGDRPANAPSSVQADGGQNTPTTEDFLKDMDSINRQVLIYVYLDPEAKDDRKGERNTLVQGYTKYVDFYSPDYEALVMPDEKDYRRTLYWNPNVKTDGDGKAKVVFYNNGQCTDMEMEAVTVCPSGNAAVAKQAGS
ncbi:MAG: hypothetical protein MJY59_05985 [Bacteroidaceae bacterium]|nr:hypothetical protein [Bacteroidaceae bacterium]